MNKKIALLPGDGIGPEIVREGKRIIETIALVFNHKFSFQQGLIGAIAINTTGNPLPHETISICSSSDAILFGAIGDPRFDNDPTAKIRPEQGILKLRKELGLYANIRPITTYKTLLNQSPLKKEVITGADFVIIRELTGGIYFGEKGRNNKGTEAYDYCSYSKREIERVGKVAFDLALQRKKKVTLVDKANVLETSRLWRETIENLAKKYKSITFEKMFVDNASMQIIKKPTAFDVILTENMFGDILSDEASAITGSIGMLPSASIGKKTSLFEPIHGSYPKAAGKNTANPIGTILSVAMMFEIAFHTPREALSIRNAVELTLKKHVGTKDIVKKNPVSTHDVTNSIISFISQ